ncbi:hypothetical protein M404DRAFT_995508 [Pisolithus tinctorius Marx 270]|uniref:Uncharacterized protein n=1 Tax=Pisolithus tinctorius Marx 270 TaxID=870435 RepID=A0A0C3PPG0_PISTI|nr:hypothetical protein M404DRAFT_995508 [Pisolithus tinctorius Marx 270]
MVENTTRLNEGQMYKRERGTNYPDCGNRSVRFDFNVHKASRSVPARESHVPGR